MPLLPKDQALLEGCGFEFDTFDEGGATFVEFKHHPLPPAYTPTAASLLIRLPPAYPNANPDMFWTSPDVSLRNGGVPLKADHHEPYNQRSWQRWSRHYPADAWRPHVDCLRTYLNWVRGQLERGV